MDNQEKCTLNSAPTVERIIIAATETTTLLTSSSVRISRILPRDKESIIPAPGIQYRYDRFHDAGWEAVTRLAVRCGLMGVEMDEVALGLSSVRCEDKCLMALASFMGSTLKLMVRWRWDEDSLEGSVSALLGSSPMGELGDFRFTYVATRIRHDDFYTVSGLGGLVQYASISIRWIQDVHKYLNPLCTVW